MIKKNFYNMFKNLLIIFFTLITNAYAYLDPGSGSIIVQILVAALATITFYFRATVSFFKSIFNKIIRLFKKKNK